MILEGKNAMGCQEDASQVLVLSGVQNSKAFPDGNVTRRGGRWICLLFSDQGLQKWEERLEEIAPNVTRRESVHVEGMGFAIRPTYLRNYRRVHSLPKPLFSHL